MGKTYEIVVIGGGIIGLSTAYYLVKEGKKVMLVEKNHIGSGASGACDDMILLQSKKPGIHLEMAVESLELYRGLSGELGVDIEFQNRGGMILIEDNEQLAIMEEFVKQQQKFGLDVHMIDGRDVKKRQPHVREGIVASTYSDKDSQVNPLKVMSGFMSKGKSLGLEIRKGATINKLEQTTGRWKISFEDGTSVETEYVVNAAGAWAPQIGQMVGIEIPITPRRGQIAVTEQIPLLGETNLWSAEYIVAKLKPELRKKRNDLHGKLGVGFAFSQTREGNCFIGSTREDAGYCKETNFQALNIIISQAVKLFPVFRNVNIIRSFAGLRPASIDGKAIIGEVEGKEGFLIAAGHEGDGIALAPITGKVVSDLICGRKVKYNMEELNLKRFGQQGDRKEVNAV